MKVLPTLNGGLRLTMEKPLDWKLLRCLPHDAASGPADLATRLSADVSHEEVSDDWQEFVVPELREEFAAQRNAVAARLEGDSEEPGDLEIPPQEIFLWYGALNQALLALEERHHFSRVEDPRRLTPDRQAVWYRVFFYEQLRRRALSCFR